MPGCSLSSCDDSWDGLQPTSLTLSAGGSGSRWWAGECNSVSPVDGQSWSLGLTLQHSVFWFSQIAGVCSIFYLPQDSWSGSERPHNPRCRRSCDGKLVDGRFQRHRINFKHPVIDLFVYLYSMSWERNTKMWGESFPLLRTSFCRGVATNRTLHQNICPAVVVGSAHNSTLATVFKGNAAGARLRSRSAAGGSCVCVCVCAGVKMLSH